MAVTGSNHWKKMSEEDDNKMTFLLMKVPSKEDTSPTVREGAKSKRSLQHSRELPCSLLVGERKKEGTPST